MNRRTLLAPFASLLFIAVVFSIASPIREAQAQAPDVIFKVIYVGDFGTGVTVGPSASPSWSDVISCGTTYGTCNQTFDGSGGGGVLQINGTTETSGSFPSGTGLQLKGATNYTITVYTKNRPTVTVDIDHAGSIDIATGGTGSVSYPFTNDDLSLHVVQTSGSTSNSPTAQLFINQGCTGANTATTTSFPEYPGVLYPSPPL